MHQIEPIATNGCIVGSAFAARIDICRPLVLSETNKGSLIMLAVMSVHEPVPLVIDRPRRTFAIISHPDAGKTTLTEKLLMFGGAIRLAGHVRARGDRRRTQSDWMEIERDRGISITSSVMTFEHGGITFNLLDTPGHEDFSEDTYRTPTAVASAIT